MKPHFFLLLLQPLFSEKRKILFRELAAHLKAAIGQSFPKSGKTPKVSGEMRQPVTR